MGLFQQPARLRGERPTGHGRRGGLMATREELLDQAGALAHHNEMTYLG
jgi:hypothetical protein